jgi:secreted Zn-dependent insulinase-like peptidase
VSGWPSDERNQPYHPLPLRTKEQLGYIVWQFRESSDNVHSLTFIVQSNKYSVKHLTERIDAFVADLLASFLPKKLDVDSKEFEDAIEELSKAKLEKLKTLGQLANRLWIEIHNGSLIFDRHEQEERALRQLSRSQVLSFAHKILVKGQRLVVGVCGKAEITSEDWVGHAKEAAVSLYGGKDGSQIITSIPEFRARLSCFPSAAQP